MRNHFYALMKDNTIKKILLENELVDNIKVRFEKSANELKPDGIEEVAFSGDFMTRKGENIYYIDFDLPESFSNIPDNQADIPDFEIGEDVPKSIFWYNEASKQYYFQMFNKGNLLDNRFWLIFHIKTFTNITENGFYVDDKVQAIHDKGKLFFQSFYSANKIFALIDRVPKATKADVDNFVGNEKIEIDSEKLSKIANSKTLRLIKLLVNNGNIDCFMNLKETKQKKLIADFGIKTSVVSGKMVLPTDKVENLNKVLEFLNEDIFVGVITNSQYVTNSKKKA